MKILVVDDEEIVRHTLIAQLDRLGHVVDGTGDGRDGLNAIIENHYDAAFIDIRMPGLDGISVLMRAKKEQPDLPVIIMSGHGSDAIREEVLRIGAYAFLYKPFRFSEIQQLMAHVAESKNAQIVL